MSATHTIGQIIEQQWPWVIEHCNTYQIRQLYATRVCRTPALGGHRYVCDQCGSKHYRYHSCRNRNCPQCQGTQKEAWITAREQQLIHTSYYHVVFTLPHHLNELLYQKPWVVYAKPPFGGAQGVIQYLARYTHKTAITNQRIQTFDRHKVTFQYTDYRHANQRKSMTLSATEFLRRLIQHFLPHRFTRIRHYGILSSRWKNNIFPDAQPLPKLDWIALWLQKGLDLTKCPTCKTGTLVWAAQILPVRGPPPKISEKQ